MTWLRPTLQGNSRVPQSYFATWTFESTSLEKGFEGNCFENISTVGVNRHVKRSDGSFARDLVNTRLYHQGANMFLQKCMVCLTTVCFFCVMIGLNLMTRIITLISPSLAKKIHLRMGEKTTMTQNPNFSYEDWGPTFTSMKFIKTVSHHMWLSLGQEAFVGGEAPDSPVISMEGNKTSICKYLKGAFFRFRLLCFSTVVSLSAPKLRASSSLQETDRWCWVLGAAPDPRLSTN